MHSSNVRICSKYIEKEKPALNERKHLTCAQMLSKTATACLHGYNRNSSFVLGWIATTVVYRAIIQLVTH